MVLFIKWERSVPGKDVGALSTPAAVEVPWFTTLCHESCRFAVTKSLELGCGYRQLLQVERQVCIEREDWYPDVVR